MSCPLPVRGEAVDQLRGRMSEALQGILFKIHEVQTGAATWAELEAAVDQAKKEMLSIVPCHARCTCRQRGLLRDVRG